MKYRVQVEGRTFEVAVGNGSGPTEVLLDGQKLDWELMEAAPGVYTLLVGGRVYDLAADRRQGGYSLVVAGVPLEAQVQDERQRILSSSRLGGVATEGQIAVRAPMPGRVKQVDVVPGDNVERGTRLVVLEAMKMENDLTAPREGLVRQVKVSEGQTVEQGQLLLIME